MKEYTPGILSEKELLEKAKCLPLVPGVYLFYDRNGTILYVGKSRALHNRVLSYFQNRGKHPPKTEKLVRSVCDFETIVTATEREALLLENEKIKLHKPKYNIRLKDDRDYPYIRLSMGEEYPRLSFAHRKEKKGDQSLYFGPYSSSGAVRSAIDTANRLFSLPTCSRRFPQDIGKYRPCLYHQMGRCMGVCTGKVTPEEYARRIEEVILFFRNDRKKIISLLKEKMEEAAEKTEFEKAALYRDRIRSLESLSGKNQIVKDLRFSADVFGVFTDEMGGCINLLSVREGRVADSTNFHFGADEILSSESFGSLLISLYRGRESLPEEILLPQDAKGEETGSLSEVLSSFSKSKVTLRYPERGEGKRLLEMANANAKVAALHRRAQYEKEEEVLVHLASLLSLEVVPERIESIDISNSGSQNITAGIIVLKNARFSKRDYRTFSMEMEHPDDVESMYRAISRRVNRFLEGDEKFSPLPDLFLVDGGKGQVGAVKRALQEAGVFVPVFGMVKDAFHKTRNLTDGISDISISHDARIFQFIYTIQEEVHRFSLSRMDRGRRKTVKTSSLTEISGIGEKKAAVLLKGFGSLMALKEATAEEISDLKGISRKDAEAVADYFQNQKKRKQEQ